MGTHKWANPPGAPPPACVELDGQRTGSLSAHAEFQRRKWAAIWQGSAPGKGAQVVWGEVPPLAPIPVQVLRDTAASFPSRTSSTDGWHPRRFAALSEQALEALSQLLSAVERLGDFPAMLRGIHS